MFFIATFSVVFDRSIQFGEALGKEDFIYLNLQMAFQFLSQAILSINSQSPTYPWTHSILNWWILNDIHISVESSHIYKDGYRFESHKWPLSICSYVFFPFDTIQSHFQSVKNYVREITRTVIAMFIACRHHTNYFILKIKFYDYFTEQMKKKEINRTRKSANGIFFYS